MYKELKVIMTKDFSSEIMKTEDSEIISLQSWKNINTDKYLSQTEENLFTDGTRYIKGNSLA